MKTFNILTNIAYPIAGWFGDWFTFAAGILLGIASGWMHAKWTERSWTADWMAMYVFFFSVLSYIIGAWLPLLILAAVCYAFIEQLRQRQIIGIVVLLVISVKYSFEPVNAGISLLLFAAAYGLNVIGENKKFEPLTHGFWHLLSAAGAYYLMV